MKINNLKFNWFNIYKVLFIWPKWLIFDLLLNKNKESKEKILKK